MKQQTNLFLIAIIMGVVAYMFYRSKAKANVFEIEPAAPLIPTGRPTANKPVFNSPIIPKKSTSNAKGFPLKQGSKGKAVKLLQILVGANPDGVWGTQTGEKVRKLLNLSQVSEELFGKLCAIPNSYDKSSYFPLKRGSNNNYSKALQVLLDVNIGTLGLYGDVTATAVKNYLGVDQCSAANFTQIVNNVLNTNY